MGRGPRGEGPARLTLERIAAYAALPRVTRLQASLPSRDQGRNAPYMSCFLFSLEPGSLRNQTDQSRPVPHTPDVPVGVVCKLLFDTG